MSHGPRDGLPFWNQLGPLPVRWYGLMVALAFVAGLWTASRRVRSWREGQIARVYYSLLLVFTAWGLIAVHLGSAMTLFKYLGTMAGFVMTVAGVQLYLVNTRLLPPELRPSWWRRAGLLLCSTLYGVMTAIAAWDVASKLLK